jgi:ATP-binding cassette, subfamily C, bacterial exporter for protease/lipase
MNQPKINPIIEVLKPFKKVFYGVAAFTATMNVLMLVPSFYMLEVYDRVLTSRNEFTLLMLSLMMLLLYVIYSYLEGVRGFATIKLGEAIDAAMNERVYTAAFELTLKQPGANGAQALNDLTNLRQFLTSAPLFAFFDAPWFPIYLAVVYVFNFWLGLFATVSVAILVVLTILNEALTKKPLGEAGKLSMVSVNLASNTMKNAEVLEAMGMLPAMRSRWFKLHQEFLDHQSLASQRAATISSISRFVRLTMQSLILGVGAYLVLLNQITAGMMIAASILLGRTLAPVEQVIASWKQFKGAVASYDRLKEMLNAYPERKDVMSLPRPMGHLSVENLVVAAPGAQKPVVQGVSFQLEPGDVLGVIGPSASGKSTLARALVGVWPTLGGSVRLDGADVHAWNKAELGPAIGYVPQDVEIFQGSLSENIARFGEIVPERVIAAATSAGIHEMVLRFPDGYNTLVGPGGGGLSGGQMQRLALARALHGDPSFIVLDEPNSNLDDAGERALVQALLQAKQRLATVVVITHRTSVLQAANKLLVMADGRVAMFGPTQQVLQKLQQNQQPPAQNPAPNKTPPQVPGPESVSGGAA